MPIYVFRCRECSDEREFLLPLGETGPRRCDECGGQAHQRFTRVAVRYNGWGFTATDRLVGDTRGKSFSELRSKAEQISDA